MRHIVTFDVDQLAAIGVHNLAVLLHVVTRTLEQQRHELDCYRIQGRNEDGYNFQANIGKYRGVIMVLQQLCEDTREAIDAADCQQSLPFDTKAE